MKQPYTWPLRGLPARTAVLFTHWLARAGVALLLLAWLLPAFAARAQAPAAGAAPSVGAALNPDGTLRKSQAGSFNARGYRMTLDPKTGAPVFRTTGTGDENWSDNFGLNGASDQVYAVATAANGDVYVGGAFAAVGTAVANNVARWNGTAWNGLGNGAALAITTNNGVNNTVFALAVLGTDLYVGGQFTSASSASGAQALSSVARWDGAAWSGLGNGATTASTTNNGVTGTVVALAVQGTNLYVGGSFVVASSAGGAQALNYVARWNGTTWSGLGNGANAATSTNNGVNGTVYALAVRGTDLYVGGSFTSAYSAGGAQPLSRVARWDGAAWSGLGNGATTASPTNNGVDATVYALAVRGTDLYVGGFFTVANSAGGTQVLNRVARWDGTAWSGLGNGAATTSNNGVNNTVYALAVLGTDLYVGGQFTSARSTSGAQALSSVARWDGTA
jgi:hypothetical protein